MERKSLATICAALCGAIGIEAPAQAAPANEELMQLVEGKSCDRILMYNPDAVASWIMDKYPQLFPDVTEQLTLKVPLNCVMPSVTPVCFGTFYTGAMPEVHGIRAYAKPVIKIDTFFDALIRAEKKVAILAEKDCSMSKIFLERDMDYYIYDTIPEIMAKAAELVLEDSYDVLVVYNGNYDSYMHKHGPESIEALAEARCNSEAFGMLYHLVKEHWGKHNTLMGFGMDHGCHEIDGHCGSHGLDMPEDIEITHWYGIIPAQN